MARRKTVKVDGSISEIIEEMLDGNIVKVENDSISKKMGWRLKDLREKGLLYKAYSREDRASYFWFDETVDESTLKKEKTSPFGDIWRMIFG